MTNNSRPLNPGTNELDELQKISSILGSPTVETWPEGLRLAEAMRFSFPPHPPTPLSKIITNASPEAIDLISQLCAWDPTRRPTVQQVLAHPYFAGESRIPSLTTPTPAFERRPAGAFGGGGGSSGGGGGLPKGAGTPSPNRARQLSGAAAIARAAGGFGSPLAAQQGGAARGGSGLPVSSPSGLRPDALPFNGVSRLGSNGGDGGGGGGSSGCNAAGRLTQAPAAAAASAAPPAYGRRGGSSGGGSGGYHQLQIYQQPFSGGGAGAGSMYVHIHTHVMQAQPEPSRALAITAPLPMVASHSPGLPYPGPVSGGGRGGSSAGGAGPCLPGKAHRAAPTSHATGSSSAAGLGNGMGDLLHSLRFGLEGAGANPHSGHSAVR
jgi:hypothetical protein